MTSVRGSGEAASASRQDNKQFVWDPVVRLLHWSVAL
jgi:hypothetical protein